MQLKPLVLTSCVGIIVLLPLFARGAGVVNNCTDSDLRTAMAGGGTVTFACDGTIYVWPTLSIAANTVLDASGHQIKLSGGNSGTVIQVNQGVTVSLFNLTICNGQSHDGTNGYLDINSSPGDPGGGIYNAGTLTLLNCNVVTNRTGNGGYGNGYMGIYPLGGAGGPGGGIYNTGTLILSNTIVSGNMTRIGGASGGYT